MWSLILVVAAMAIQPKVVVEDLKWFELQPIPSNIGHIRVPKLGNARCMGFFFEKDKIITNNHCVPSKRFAKGVTIFLDEEKVKCQKFITTNHRLDYTVLKCEDERTPLTAASKFEGQVFVVHYQCDYPKNRWCESKMMVSPGDVTKQTKNDFRHDADTLAGSSGAPIINMKGELVGVHKAGYGRDNFQRGEYNIALKFSAFLKDYYKGK